MAPRSLHPSTVVPAGLVWQQVPDGEETWVPWSLWQPLGVRGREAGGAHSSHLGCSAPLSPSGAVDKAFEP